MSTSGTTNFNETRDQLIGDALTLLGVLAAGETAQPNDVTFCSSALNKMVKAWMAQGIHLWTEESGTLFLNQGQAQYNIYSGAGAYASSGSNTVETTLTANITSGTSITVSSTSNTQNPNMTMQVGDSIGICLNNQTIFWTTILSVVGTTVTLNGSVTSAANSGNSVYTYTTQCPRVLSIQAARLRNQAGFDITMDIKPRQDYMNIPNKTTTGTPIILYYSPQLTQGEVYIWPCTDDVNKRIEFTYLRTIQDFDNASDTPDLPQEWLEAITYNLAVRIAPAYGVSLSSGGYSGNPDILRMAAQYLEDMKAWDAEQPYIQIVRKSYGFD